MRLEFERGADLNRKVYVFYALIHAGRVKAILDVYREDSRQTKRHKWTADKRYERLSRQASNMDMGDVVIPQDVKSDVSDSIVNSIDVVTEL